MKVVIGHGIPLLTLDLCNSDLTLADAREWSPVGDQEVPVIIQFDSGFEYSMIDNYFLGSDEEVPKAVSAPAKPITTSTAPVPWFKAPKYHPLDRWASIDGDDVSATSTDVIIDIPEDGDDYLRSLETFLSTHSPSDTVDHELPDDGISIFTDDGHHNSSSREMPKAGLIGKCKAIGFKMSRLLTRGVKAILRAVKKLL